MKKILYSFTALALLLCLSQSVAAQSCQVIPACSKAKETTCNKDAAAIKTASVEVPASCNAKAAESKIVSFATLARPSIQVASLVTSRLSDLFYRITNKGNLNCEPSCCIPTCNPACCDAVAAVQKK